MIFATDHDAGNRIMTNLYNTAANEFPAMRTDARLHRERLAEREAGIQTLFDDAAPVESPLVSPREKLYEHSAPWTPFGTAETP